MVRFEPRKQLLTVRRKSWRSNCLNAVAGCEYNISNISFAKFRLPGVLSLAAKWEVELFNSLCGTAEP